MGGASQISFNPNHVETKLHSNVNPLLVCLMGIPFKCRMITPFTTDHAYLGRFARGIVNMTTLFLLWAFSGFVFDVGSSLPMGALWAISIVSCFILGWLFTSTFELIMMKHKGALIKICKYGFGLVIYIALHAPVIFFTVHMGDEFWHWVGCSAVLLFAELCIWETISMFFQTLLLIYLQKSPETQKGGNAGMRKMITPPLFKRVFKEL